MLSAIRYPLSANKMFIDKIEIEVEAGRGGNGVNSFYRDKFVRPGRKGRGRPDGGDGGNGGDVILKASSRMHTLLDFYYKKNFSGEKGSHGQGNGRRGRNGSDCLIEVPCGTVVKDLKIKGSSSVIKVGTKAKIVRIVAGDHDLDCKVDGMGPMMLKSSVVKKA